MWGLRPILDLRPINRALCKRPFRMITLKQILGQIRPGDWFASVDLKDAYFHIQIAPHHRRFLRFAFEGTAYQYSVLPFGLAQGERDTLPQLSGRLADFSSVLGHATQPHRLAAYSLGVPRAMCKHAKEHPRPESVHNISGSLHGLPGNESLPLVGTHGRPFCLTCTISEKAALFIWRNFRGCWDSWRQLRQYVIWAYYTCARCSYGLNPESPGQRGLRDVWVSLSQLRDCGRKLRSDGT